MGGVISAISVYALPAVIFFIPVYALVKGVKVYEVFTEGAKDGAKTALSILPFLVCMLCAVGMFRASGAMDWLVRLIAPLTDLIGIPAEVVPMGVMRTFSGGGAQGLLVDVLHSYGADSLIGQTASIAMGSTETTFYVIAVYFGSVGITKIRHAAAVGVIADCTSLVVASLLARALWG